MKNVLVLIHDDDGQEARLQGALDAARALQGHLTCAHVTEFTPVIGADAYNMSGGVMMLEVEEEIERENRAKVEKRLSSEDVPFEWIEITGAIEPAMKDAAQLADLIVVNSETSNFFQPQLYKLVERLVIKSGKPLLSVPTEKGFRPADPVMVAWDGSGPASEALRAATPLLELSDSVTLLEIEDGSAGAPVTDAAEYLSRHGIKAEVVREKAPIDDSVSSVLLSELESGRFGWAVMGAFSTSRFRQALFGGTTKCMLKEAPVPLLIAH